MLKAHPEIQCTKATSTILLDTVKVVQLPFNQRKLDKVQKLKHKYFKMHSSD